MINRKKKAHSLFVHYKLVDCNRAPQVADKQNYCTSSTRHFSQALTMEHHLRNALWMFVFVGYLQAYPLTTADRGNNPKLPCDAFQRDDLDFKKELDGVSCVSYFTIKTMYLIVQQTFGPFKYCIMFVNLENQPG